MKPKILIIISSGSEAKEKALTGLMYAVNAVKNEWAEIKLVFFGPVEDLIAERDEEIVEMIEKFSQLSGKPLACRRIAENRRYVERLEEKVNVVYVGSIISSLIAEGYTPLVF